ncbi:NAD(P)/FAD-dependent oxidoreductase [Methanofollis fontis]|uniref:NAD(P)/FAD-dependent oxidoreductase n=1 Tax=Methanofollis fontis TaxID=2052832 RepID=A0A483CTT7_9EURY|nr:hypothetical protein [Methanofollis fontis]TAJ44718.1 hypothetical protein CUJ86_05310 [Methanofollis fontis]
MKVAVAGAGVGGSLCARILAEKGFDVDLIDIIRTNACSIAPCAWMTTREIVPLLRTAGLNADDFILKTFASAVFCGYEVGADLITVDKPALINALRGDLPVSTHTPDTSEYDRIIDATGTARAYLPPPKNDDLVSCVQFKGTLREGRDLPEVRFIHGGYAWSFPLGGGEFHVGCLSHLEDPRLLIRTCPLFTGLDSICGCTSTLRVTSPWEGGPFVSGNVWGVGESIGCVYPLVGDGIIPAIRSVHLLIRHWEDAGAYEDAIRAEFPQMKVERDILVSLKQGQRPRLSQLRKIDPKRLGVSIGAAEAAALFLKVISSR